MSIENKQEHNGDDEDVDDDFTFTDEDHVHASISFFDPTVLNSLEEEFGRSPAAKIDDGVNLEKEKEQDETTNEEGEEGKNDIAPPTIPPRKKAARRRSSILKQALVKNFTAQEEKTVLKVLKQISVIEERQRKTGFNEMNFTAGVMNCFFVAYTFGAHPEHFWLVYLLESLYFIPSKFRNMVRSKPLNQALYYFDFCWMMNLITMLFLMLLVSPLSIEQSTRRFIYHGAFGVACGPLLGATGILPFVGFVFHDVNTMTNLVIHALPPMLLYTLRWHGDDIRKAWPDVFQLDHSLQDTEFFPPGRGPFFLPGTGLGSIAGNALFIYLFLWFIPYVSWMLLVGMDLPRKNRRNGKTPKYDTVFHSFWRAGACQTFGRIFWKRPNEKSQQQMKMDDYEIRDFFLYMSIHFTLVSLSIPVLAFACHSSKHLNMFLLVMVLLACVHRGSQRYTYYTTKMYSRIIRKEFLTEDS